MFWYFCLLRKRGAAVLLYLFLLTLKTGLQDPSHVTHLWGAPRRDTVGITRMYVHPSEVGHQAYLCSPLHHANKCQALDHPHQEEKLGLQSYRLCSVTLKALEHTANSHHPGVTSALLL